MLKDHVSISIKPIKQIVTQVGDIIHLASCPDIPEPLLTGKALKDFVEFHFNRVDFSENSREEYYGLFFSSNEDTHQTASIVEWFDAVGIFIVVVAEEGKCEFGCSRFDSPEQMG